MAKETPLANNKKKGPPEKAAPPARKPLPKAGDKSPRKSTQKAAIKPGGTSLWARIPNERKIDALGVVMALAGLLTLLSMISRTKGSLTDRLVTSLGQLTGLGAFVIPLALIIGGVWLILRHIEKLPPLSIPRLAGMVLLYLNILAFLHLFFGGDPQLGSSAGGGVIGSFFAEGLVSLIGTAGAVVMLLAWLIVALTLTFDVSAPDLVRFFAPLQKKLQAFLQTPIDQGGALAKAGGGRGSRSGTGEDLPADFRPLQPKPEEKIAPRSEPAPTSPTRLAGTQPAQGAAAAPAASGAAGPAAGPVPQAPAAPQLPNPWTLPAIDAILEEVTPVTVAANQDKDRGRVIEETLASFGAPAHIVDISRGPTVTQFGVEPDFVTGRGGAQMRVRVSKIVGLADDIALALAAPRIRIQAPVPGRNYVGIEVPNTEISRVSLREIVESEQFTKIKSSLRFAVGKDVSGKPVAYDLASMPHLLIAGTTGSGKSVCVNAILACLLMNNTPLDLRLVLVDPKRVELTGYNGIPQLLAPVVVDPERVTGALQWMMREMDSRYHKFSALGVRNIVEYNARNTTGEHLPYLVVIVDELADLMMMAPEETERSITRLAQLARATGIHLILATQRPSVDVVTGLIKANFPSRIAFAVASGIDSRVILDQPGAERLLGRGDMLFQAPDAPAPVRLQGVYVSDSEIQRLVDYWRLASSTVKNVPIIPGGPIDAVPAGVPLKQAPLWDEVDMDEAGDPLLAEAIDLVRREGRASITMLQRRLRIGYTRSARLIDAMEKKKIIAPPEANSQVREVLDYGPVGPPADNGA